MSDYLQNFLNPYVMSYTENEEVVHRSHIGQGDRPLDRPLNVAKHTLGIRIFMLPWDFPVGS